MNAAAECVCLTLGVLRAALGFCFVYETLTLWCMERKKTEKYIIECRYHLHKRRNKNKII